MAANEKQVLDLSGAGIKKLEKKDGVGFKSLILDNNELTKLENLECFPDVEKVSASGNAIVRMYNVNKCHHITHLNLPNNNIICIEGLKEMPNLVFLNLSVNNIKTIQNLQHSSALVHLDLSRNNISSLSDISNLAKLKILHLNGNKISTLNRASKYIPTGICTLSLADNCVADLNEISNLGELLNLEQLTISGNPCLSTDELSLPTFDYRPFVINWCLGLRLLDGRVASQKESLKAEWLYSQGKGRHYKPGEHLELIEYLCQVCPVVADQSTDEEDEKLSRILHKQRQHKEEFLNKMSQSMHVGSSEVSRPDDINPMAQSYHFKTETASKGSEAELILPSNVVPSKIMYESAPEVLFHCSSSEPAQNAPPSFQSGKYPRSVSKSEILHSSIKSPITIEQVSVDNMDTSPKPKVPEGAKSPYQYYEDRRVRPSSASETKTHTPKGTLIRKVSKRATSPCSTSSAPGRSKLPHSTSSKSRISPSRSCILTARLSSAAKNSSESDTSEELSHGNRTPQRSFRSLSSDTQSGINSPILHQKYAPAALSPTKRVFGLSAKVQDDLTPDDFSKKMPSFPPQITKSKTMSEIYGKSEEDIARAAIRIQSAWRGYFVRHHNPRVSKMLQEIRFRRLEDHIQHLHGHLCRLTDFVLRQQQDLQHERELRKRQSEDIRHLHEKARDLQKCVTVALTKAKSNVFQNVSEHDISSKDSPREGSLPDSKIEKLLPGQSTESLNLALRYSTQAFQENSGLYSPSSQTSSVTSSVPDTTFSRPKSRRDLQPSTSDVSDADSGMQSMVSPNVGNVDCDRNTLTDIDHSLLNGYANDIGSYPSYRKASGDFIYQKNVKHMNLPSERESDYDETMRSKMSMYQTRNASGVRHSVPLASISSSGEDSWHIQHGHDIGYTNSCKYGIPPQKISYVEYSNSSVENSPCSAFASEDCDNPLTRAIAEPHAFSRHHIQTNHVSQTKLEESSKHKNVDAHVNSDYMMDKEHQGSDSLPGCCSKVGTSQQARDKMHMHHPRCSKSFPQCSCKHSGKMCDSHDPCNYKSCSVLPKGLNQFAQSKVTSPLEDIDSPQSPCTVEMSGRISHSCSFQSDGFTAAEELSATATVKVFSTRAVSMTCTNGTLSPQTSSQRPISLSDASPQTNLRSPLVLAANVWDKKVQDIESTFHQLQTQMCKFFHPYARATPADESELVREKCVSEERSAEEIRDLERTFGQIGQLGQIFYPAILQDDPKESRPALHCVEPSSGALVLDMPKINFKRTDNTNNDLLFQTRFSSNVPFLSHSSVAAAQHQQVAQNLGNCRVEEIDTEVQPLQDAKDIPKGAISDNQDSGKMAD